MLNYSLTWRRLLRPLVFCMTLANPGSSPIILNYECYLKPVHFSRLLFIAEDSHERARRHTPFINPTNTLTAQPTAQWRRQHGLKEKMCIHLMRRSEQDFPPDTKGINIIKRQPFMANTIYNIVHSPESRRMSSSLLRRRGDYISCPLLSSLSPSFYPHGQICCECNSRRGTIGKEASEWKARWMPSMMCHRGQHKVSRNTATDRPERRKHEQHRIYMR